MTTADDWSTADLIACIERADPEAYAQVIRALAAKLDRDGYGVTDPRSLLVDLSRAVDSLASAADRIVRTACEEAPFDELAAVVAHLNAGGSGLAGIADGWI